MIDLPTSLLNGTRAVDATGRLLVFHHATNKHFEAFEHSSDLGFHFGSKEQAAKRRQNMISRGEAEAEDTWRIISCVLAIRNPLIMPDDPGIWGPRWLTATLVSHLDDLDKERIRELAVYFDERGGWVDDDISRQQLRNWMAVLKGALQRSGYDGIVYRNVFESTGRAIEWSWVAFDDAQIIRLKDANELVTLPATGVQIGSPPRLRGAGPKRIHQERGLGYLSSQHDVVAFRKAVETWAQEAGIEWVKNYPLDYEPSFGEARPSEDLQAITGEIEGYRIRVCSKKGSVDFIPFSKRSSRSLMQDFRSLASESFCQHGLSNAGDREKIVWRPGEALVTFTQRLAAVYGDFHATFAPDLSQRMKL